MGSDPAALRLGQTMADQFRQAGAKKDLESNGWGRWIGDLEWQRVVKLQRMLIPKLLVFDAHSGPSQRPHEKQDPSPDFRGHFQALHSKC